MSRLVICLVFVLAAFSGCSSCVIDPQTISIWGGDIQVPELLSVYPVSTYELTAEFSDLVTVNAACVEQTDDSTKVIETLWNQKGASSLITFVMAETPGIGVTVVLSASVQDSGGNSYSFTVPFTGYNERVPDLRISEIRTGYTKPKVEYIEILVLSDGNLAGVAVYNAMNSIKSTYEFPACEVQAGDFVLWHLRSVEEGLICESNAMDASLGTDSSNSAWDFWDTQERSPLKSTNVLLLQERIGGRILDALLCAESKYDAWPSEAVRLAAEAAVEAGAWGPTALITDAVCSDYMTPTRTLGRIPQFDDTDCAGNWMVCATSCASPGTVNSSKPHVP